MRSTIQHQPRVAWDAARALVTAARASDAIFEWCRDRVAFVLGPMAAAALDATRLRLTNPGAAPSETQVQTGLWRVRLDDALRSNPSAGHDLRDIAAQIAIHRSAG